MSCTSSEPPISSQAGPPAGFGGVIHALGENPVIEFRANDACPLKDGPGSRRLENPGILHVGAVDLHVMIVERLKRVLSPDDYRKALVALSAESLDEMQNRGVPVNRPALARWEASACSARVRLPGKPHDEQRGPSQGEVADGRLP
jgi:hypothetical protein